MNLRKADGRFTITDLRYIEPEGVGTDGRPARAYGSSVDMRPPIGAEVARCMVSSEIDISCVYISLLANIFVDTVMVAQ